MKKILVGGIVLVVLVIITVWINAAQKTSTIQGEFSDFAIKDTASIDRIILKDASGNKVELDRKGSIWMVNQTHKARPDAVDILLSTMHKVSLRAPISQQQMNSVLKNIISSHTLVEAYSGSTLMKSYFVGGPDRDHTGTYMLMKGSNRPFLTHIEGHHGFLTTRFFTNALEWRDRAVFELPFGAVTMVSINYPGQEANNFSIEQQESGVYEIFTGEKSEPLASVDSFMVSAYLKNYEQIHFESYEETKSEEFLDSVKVSKPIFEIALTDVYGNTKLVSGFKKPLKEGYDPEGNSIEFDLDRLYLWIDSNEMVIGQYAIFDKITRSASFFKKG